MKKLLPVKIFNALCENVEMSKLYELRIRADKEVIVNENSVYHNILLPQSNSIERKPLMASKADLDYIVYEACEHSIYSFTNQIKQGFITYGNGIRIGLCGEVVEDAGGNVQTLKNLSSLVIRVPHEIKNCSLTAQNLIYGTGNDGIRNTLIISPPGAGKTTFLRDIARGISHYLPELNVLICDERGEIASVADGVPRLDVGHCDVLSYASKEYVFREGVRALKPDVLICDELASDADVFACERLASQGVKIIASAHGATHRDLMLKSNFNNLLAKQIFKRYIILSNRNGAGTYEGVLDENFNVIF